MRPMPRKGDRFRHWKNGHVYVVSGVSRDEADPVVARVAYEREDGSDEIPWSRTLEDFLAIIPAERVVEVLGGVLMPMERFERLPASACVPRPVIMAFAEFMEDKLRRNDHKGGWAGRSPISMLPSLEDEITELRRALCSSLPAADVTEEAVDVANFCLMIADLTGGLK